MKSAIRGSLALAIVIAIMAALFLPTTTRIPAQGVFTWKTQDSGIDSWLSGVAAVDANHVWAVGAFGTILFYDGLTWSPQDSGIPSLLKDVTAVDASHVWASGMNGKILFYDGSTWTQQDNSASGWLCGISAADANHVWAVGGIGKIFHTSNGGASWTEQSSGTTKDLWRVMALDANHAWAVGDEGTILHTSNGGASWNEQSSGTTKLLEDVTALDANHAWAVGYETILYTSNGGASWNEQEGGAGMLLGISAADANHVWAVSDGGKILFYDGTSWNEQSSGTTNGLYGVSSCDAQNVWAVGLYGTIVYGETEASEWYFAEGTCRPGFDPYICIQNPSSTEAEVKITYMKGDGTTEEQLITVDETSRSTVVVKDTLGEANDAAHDFSTKVESTNEVEIIVERPMYFKYKGIYPGGHDVIGATSPSTTFYFAEGTCRPGFDPYICIQNPSSTEAEVKITYMKGDGTTEEQLITVDETSRSTVVVKDTLGEANDAAHDFSAKVESTNRVGIIAERPIYFNYQGYTQLNWPGGHDVVGF